ncbi:MAG: phosphotransferase family protein [Deltaproteobacteria bacterium]|nr:phosphotransferase family protein [Deltaproteobacteria bacterium]
MSVDNRATAVRPGEELDQVKVEAYLKSVIPGLTGSLAIQQFPSGYSNLTYLISVGDRDLVLRRPPHGTKAKTAHDMSREYKVLTALRPWFPYCPQTLAFCTDPAVMGTEFYVMERIDGLILRREVPPELGFGPPEMETLTRRLMEVMAELHAVDYQAAGLAGLGKPQGYVTRQVEGWSKRFRNARTPDVPDGEEVMAWLAAEMPPESPIAALIHNDFKLDNVVLDRQDPLKVVGVLDWEMATLGDPLMDLACTLAYWPEAGDPGGMLAQTGMPTALPGCLTRREAVAYYGQITGRVMDRMDFYYTFGLFRLAVIAQQIYYRFFHGQTQDKRFARLGPGVGALLGQAQRVMAGETL